MLESFDRTKKSRIKKRLYFNHPDSKTPGRFSEISGVILILSSLYLLLCLFTYNRMDSSFFTFSIHPVKNSGGIVGAYLSDIIFTFLGLSGFLLPLLLIISGIKRILKKSKRPYQFLGSILLLFALSLSTQLVADSINNYFDLKLIIHVDPIGGSIGYLFSSLFRSLFSDIGAYIISIMAILVSIILLSPISLIQFISKSFKKGNIEEASKGDYKGSEIVRQSTAEEILIQPTQVKEISCERNFHQSIEGYNLPSLELLKDPQENISGPSKEELNIAVSGIEKKLADFGVIGKIKQAYPGPVVTMYEFEPAPGIKINKIVSLSDDLALALRAPSIRVYPISGKAAIGIEVPNLRRATVSLKEILASEVFQSSPSLLTLALGKDIFGNPVVTDLSKMPHLLVAGTTGSGKSVFMNSMIISLLYKTTPDDVKMLMIDPKLLELSVYSDIPHLISPVITNPKEASDALKKIVLEMERRYRLIAENGSRNIATYNRSVPKEEKLPYIVVFIDELADLMFTTPKDVENAITRLAQMARASGIHLILATQRPSVDVITGLIKANFPARISFQVTSKIDSRTILDTQGAEQLLGMGDMLFMVPGVKIMRIHGAYVSESEVREVVNFIKSQRSPEYSSFESISLPEQLESEEDSSEERDDVYKKVIEFASSVGEISISSIQRRFKIGYNRAARIMELLEQDGLVGPPKGAGKPRDFLGKR
jgi:S-DNA-T family DNA segregation ATPase FtsK/SpoIIIE